MVKTFDLFNVPDNHKKASEEIDSNVLERTDSIEIPSEENDELVFNIDLDNSFNKMSDSEKDKLSNAWNAYLAGIIESRGIIKRSFEKAYIEPFYLTIWYDGGENFYPIPNKVKDYLTTLGEEKESYIVIKDVDKLITLLKDIEPYTYRKNYKVLNVLVKLQEVKEELKNLSSDDMEIIDNE